MMKRSNGLALLMVLAIVALCGASTAAGVQRLSDGILVPVNEGFLRLQVRSDSIVRVLFSKVREPRVDELMIVKPQRTTPPKWTLQTSPANATLTTSKLRVTVNLADGTIAFADSAGRPILA